MLNYSVVGGLTYDRWRVLTNDNEISETFRTFVDYKFLPWIVVLRAIR